MRLLEKQLRKFAEILRGFKHKLTGSSAIEGIGPFQVHLRAQNGDFKRVSRASHEGSLEGALTLSRHLLYNSH